MNSKRATPERPAAEKHTDQSHLSSAPRRTRHQSAGHLESAPHHVTVTPEEREELIAIVAYFRAERRGFGPGGEVEDWLAAEREIDTALASGHGLPGRAQ